MSANKRLYLLAFKLESRLEVWEEQNDVLQLKAEFPFTASSGVPGPKLCEGDKQIPEGIYEIEYLNPKSKYHLSMKLNYPNAFDREMAMLDNRENPGSDIFIHGGAESVGCIAIGDEAIEQLYDWVSEIGKEQVLVCIAPYDLRLHQCVTVDISMPVWTEELYKIIMEHLKKFKINPGKSG